MTYKEKHCKRCGKCCITNAFSFIEEDDIARWKAESREDILHIIQTWHPVWAGDHLISSESGNYIYSCPFLFLKDNLFGCSIYNTRPKVCREYKVGSSLICPLYEE